MTNKPQATADTQRVLAALTGIQRAYPLERRIKNEACDDTRETYLAVLLRWLQTGTAPLTEGFDRESLDELTALDAIFIVNDQIGCPPFNVVKTDILVHFPHETLHVLSALDALALPRMLNTAATVETQCAMSGQPIHFSLTEEGKIRTDESSTAVVAFQKVANSITRYTFDLAPGIRFVLPEHAGTLQQTLTLDEASVVANTYYSFQRKLIQDVAM